MARPREFDTDEALQDAMNVFWEKGYEGASLPDLLEGMGITRGSLYKAYTDKKNLFLQALSNYDRDVLEPAILLLRTRRGDVTPPPIQQIFASVLVDARRGDRRGCLICNAAAGSAAEDEEIGRIVAAMLKRLKNAFVFALKEESGESTIRDADVARRAQVLTTTYVGLRVLLRSGAPVKDLENTIAGLFD
ncbi:MAG: TetR/AcrR family transcriptional regulator [Pseudomonadota bacterium]